MRESRRNAKSDRSKPALLTYSRHSFASHVSHQNTSSSHESFDDSVRRTEVEPIAVVSSRGTVRAECIVSYQSAPLRRAIQRPPLTVIPPARLCVSGGMSSLADSTAAAALGGQSRALRQALRTLESPTVRHILYSPCDRRRCTLPTDVSRTSHEMHSDVAWRPPFQKHRL